MPSPRATSLAVLLLASAAVPARGAISLSLSPGLPTTADTIRVRVAGEGCVESSTPAASVSVSGRHVAIQGATVCIVQPLLPFDATYSVGPLPAGDYTLDAVVGGQPASTSFRVREPATDLALVGGRFTVTASFSDSRTGAAALAPAVALSDESGYFSFFDSGNVEITVKILDGRPVNGHFWVFVASMTDVAWSLHIGDSRLECDLADPPPASCSTIYRSPAGKNQNVIDLGTLAP